MNEAWQGAFLAAARYAGIDFSARRVGLDGEGLDWLIPVLRDGGARAVATVAGRESEILITDGTREVCLEEHPMLHGLMSLAPYPVRPPVVLRALQRGIPAVGGLPVLAGRVAGGAGQEMAEALSILRQCVENIVLIGMPGCGKTTIGGAVAALSGRRLVDIDDEIIARAGMEIPRIFAEYGEPAFRAIERESIVAASRRVGCVIATGGGSVLDERNRMDLRMNGRVVYLRRPLEQLAVEGRPLSLRLVELAAARIPLYETASDAAVDNTDTVDGVAKRVWAAFTR